jgi:hypothetical protein
MRHANHRSLWDWYHPVLEAVLGATHLQGREPDVWGSASRSAASFQSAGLQGSEVRGLSIELWHPGLQVAETCRQTSLQDSKQLRR